MPIGPASRWQLKRDGGTAEAAEELQNASAKSPRRRAATTAQVALGAVLALFCVQPARAAAASPAASTLAPLPSSDYAVRAACAPPLPGRASCQALELVPRSPQARLHTHPLDRARRAPLGEPSPAEGDYGLTPADLHSAYRLPTSAPTVQTIALVDAYNDPAAEEDLAVYDSTFQLPACTTANGCFEQVNQNGEASHLPFPKTVAELNSARKGARAAEAEEATEWGVEMSLDIETARGICQSCHILLVEARGPADSDLEAAERAAEALHAEEISNSWAGPEEGETEASEQKSPFDDPGTVITASAGDSGYLSWQSPWAGSVEYPASSPHVVAVGGTRLTLTSKGAWAKETVWNGYGAGGGGCSKVFTAPAWQLGLANWSAVGCENKRAVADVSADADPYRGVAVEDSTSPECEYTYDGHVQHWCTIGGTSLASPLISSVFALAGGSGGVAYPASTLYANDRSRPASLHDITEGSNGECSAGFNDETGVSDCSATEEAASCSARAICLAGSGYDGPSGLGTPDGVYAFEAVPSGEVHEEPAKSSGEGTGGEGPSGESGSGSGEGGSQEGESGESGGGAGESTGGTDESREQEQLEAEAAAVLEAVRIHAHSKAPTAAASLASELSALALGPVSSQAARSPGAKLSQIDFSFASSAATHVGVTLARRVVVHGHARWRKLAHAANVQAARGLNAHVLATGRTLAPGSYRLTLKPAHGRAQSLSFVIH